ncbi:MAG: methyltransferase domain-containing protein [Solirubrobacterales bacterium]
MESGNLGTPPTRNRVMGRALNATVARAPWLWPLLRRPMRAYFDDSAQGWDDRVGARSAEYLAPLSAASTYVSPAPERILDLGTGTGEGALLLAREFPTASIRGIDVSEEMIRKAQRKVGLDPQGRVAFRVGDAAALPWDPDSFDLVSQLNVPPFFGEIARVLRPGGHYIAAASLGSHTPFYTPPSVLERGLKRRGLEVVAAGEVGIGTYLVARAGPA